jgi:hypothetical protein
MMTILHVLFIDKLLIVIYIYNYQLNKEKQAMFNIIELAVWGRKSKTYKHLVYSWY